MNKRPKKNASDTFAQLRKICANPIGTMVREEIAAALSESRISHTLDVLRADLDVILAALENPNIVQAWGGNRDDQV
jgi:hypothetical protein